MRRGEHIDSLLTFGSPVDTRAPLPVPIAPEVVARLASELAESGLLSKLSMPGWMARTGFKMSDGDPVAATPPPTLGAHTDEVLVGLGYSETELKALRKAGAI